MRGDVNTIKEKLDITEVVSGYIKLEKAGVSFKARCPFHNEKTASFFVSPARQSFYCFGCGAKGDIFTFVEKLEGLDFRGALKLLAEKAGVELEYQRSESKTEKDKILNLLEDATEFFEKSLAGSEFARRYLDSRKISAETTKAWRIGYAPGPPASGWRSLCNHLENLGYSKSLILKAGLIRTSDTSASKESYDVFRDRIIFPLTDSNGKIIAFSGRALSGETEPKYLNSPDTILFAKSEVLYGLDKAKDQIRKKNYAVLVEGQIDLVLSHQAGVSNTVAASGTAFTHAHLARLQHLSPRIILAFDADSAGEKAAERASELALSLGLEVKVADLPEGFDPAEIIAGSSAGGPEKWRNILRQSLPAVELFFNRIEKSEQDPRKLGKQIEKKILPIIKLIKSAIEQSHFISMIAKRTGIKEELLWEDLKKAKSPVLSSSSDLRTTDIDVDSKKVSAFTQKEQIEKRLAEIKLWQKELSKSSPEALVLKREQSELISNLSEVVLRDNLARLSLKLSRAEISKNNKLVESLTSKIQKVLSKIRVLEENKKVL
ncbi:MAG: DNA primase [Candidatus Zambryskibacteria bacterium]|nr:DNA primase [Candidatus Zambryskibacteria bacterium]